MIANATKVEQRRQREWRDLLTQTFTSPLGIAAGGLRTATRVHKTNHSKHQLSHPSPRKQWGTISLTSRIVITSPHRSQSRRQFLGLANHTISPPYVQSTAHLLPCCIIPPMLYRAVFPALCPAILITVQQTAAQQVAAPHYHQPNLS